MPRKAKGNGWLITNDEIVRYSLTAVAIAVVVFLILTDKQLNPQPAFWVRVLLSLAAATWGATLPGNLEVVIRQVWGQPVNTRGARTGGEFAAAGIGAFAVFLIVFFASPYVFPGKLPVPFTGSSIPLTSASTALATVTKPGTDQWTRATSEQVQEWKNSIVSPLYTNPVSLVLRAKFDKAYLPFDVKVVFKADDKSLDDCCILNPGIAAIVDDSDRLLRQLKFGVLTDPGDGSGNPNNLNRLEIEDADKGALLLVACSVSQRDASNPVLKTKFDSAFQPTVSNSGKNEVPWDLRHYVHLDVLKSVNGSTVQTH